MCKDKANTPSFSSAHSGLNRKDFPASCRVPRRSFRQRLTQGIALGFLAIALSACGFVDEGVNKSEPPLVGDDNYPVAEGDTLDKDASTGVLANDSDAGGAALTAKLVSGPAHATSFVFNTDGSFTYEHDGSEPQFYATALKDTFVYVANDGVKDSEPKTVVIDVSPVNDPPVIVGLRTDPFNSPEDATISMSTSLIVNDPDNTYPDDFTFMVADGANYTPSGDGLVPDPNYSGQLNVSVTVNDGAADSNSLDFSLTVLPVNDAPVISGQKDPMMATAEDVQRTIVPGDVDFDDVDNPNNLLTLAVLPGANYSVTGNTIEPTLNYNGNLTVPITMSDGDATSTPFNLSVTVTPVNDAPAFASTEVTTAIQGVPYSYNIATTDADVGDTLMISGVLPASGWLTLTDNGNGTATLMGVPGSADVGNNAVTLTVTDAAGASDTQAFVIAVGNVNDPPAFNSVPITAATQGDVYTYNITAIDPDVGDTLAITGALPASGWLALTDNGNGTATLTGTPGNADVGNNAVTLTVTDAAGANATQAFTIAVANINDPPAFNSTPVINAAEGAVYTYNVTTTDIDLNDTRTISGTLPASGWLTLTDNTDGTATLTGTPAATDAGANDVTLTVADAAGASVNQPFTIMVNGAPVINTAAVTTATAGVAYSYDVNATDPNAGDVLTYSLNIFPAGMTIDAATGLISWPTPVAGSHAVVVQVTDSVVPPLNTTQSFTLTVAAALAASSNKNALTTSRSTVPGVPSGPICWTTPQEQTLNSALPGEPLLIAPLTYSLINGTRNGDVSVDAAGQFTYTPTVGRPRGRDSFDYQVEDTNGDVRIRTATVITNLKIMLLGDSVTTGVTDASDPANPLPVVGVREGYRKPLFEALQAAGYEIDFVGSQRSGSEAATVFDVDNEGHEGWSAAELALGSAALDPTYPDSGIYFWLTQTPADVVLLHTGTDVRETTVDGMTAILDAIDRWESDTGGAATVLLARIIDQNPPRGEATAFNSALQTLADTRIASGDKIVVIDQQAALQDADGLPDPALYGDAQHPNVNGYGKMAETWFKQLTSVLEKCP